MIDGALFLAIPLRNAGAGIGVLHGWYPIPEIDIDTPHAEPDEFRMIVRDLYVPAGDVGFWQGAIRDTTDVVLERLCPVIARRERFAVDLLYGDHEGGQRVISRFALVPASDDIWLCSVARHWNVDRDDPR